MMKRRTFLQGACAVPLSSAIAVPTPRFPRRGERILVLLELEGGNDGLNTLIPTADDAYAAARPTLASVRDGAHDLGQGFGLHPALERLHALWGQGELAAIHGVGYPGPDRSHFRSRDIWHTADPTFARRTAETTGWLGRVADLLAAGGGADVPAAAIGGAEVTLALQARRAVVPVLDGLDGDPLRVDTRDGALEARRKALAEIARRAGDTSPGLLDEIAAVASAAVDQAERLRRGLAAYRPRAEYPRSGLGQDLELVARMAAGGLGTRVFHVRQGGYDTHARQLPVHAGLLQELDGALGAFAQDLRAHDLWDRTLVVVQSEFGRRLAENQSLGTDHGAASCAFALGGAVRGGQHLGEPPSLTDLDDGDPRMTTDFRRLFAAATDWLGVDGEAVLGGAFEPLELSA